MSSVTTSNPPAAENPSISYPDYCYIETAIGLVTNRNNITTISDFSEFQHSQSAFTSMYRFTSELETFVAKTGSVSKMPPTSVWSDYLWLDIDSSDDLESAKETATAVISNLSAIDKSIESRLVLYFSGMKGFHLGIPSVLFGLVPSSDLPQIHKKLALKLAAGREIDCGIYQQTRLLRLPGSLHEKSGLYKVRLSLEQLLNLSVAEIMTLASQRTGNPELDLISTCAPLSPIDELVEMVAASNSTTENFRTGLDPILRNNEKPSSSTVSSLRDLKSGHRHNTYASLIGKLNRIGISPEDIIELLRIHARDLGFEAELINLVRDMTSRYTSISSTSVDIYNTENIDNFVAVPLKQFLDTTERDIRWLVDGLIPVQSASIFAGYPGSGKTFILADLALAVSTGTRFLDRFETVQGRVLIIDEENSPQLMAHRFSGLMAGRSLHEPPSTLRIALGHGFRFDSPEYLRKLEAILADFRPTLVIVDSLIRVHNGEENSSSEMSKIFGRVKALMQEYEISFVFSDHLRKPGMNGSSMGANLRGSTDKWAFVDTLCLVSKESNRIDVEQIKSRFREEHLSIALKLTDEPEGCISLEYIGDARQLKRAALLQDSKSFLVKTIGDDWIPRKTLMELGNAEGLKKGLMDKALKELSEFGIIIKEEQKTEGRGPNRHVYKRNPEHSADSGIDQ